MNADDLTLFERTKIQMEMLVPFVRGLQRELGEDVVNDAIDRMHARRTAEAHEAHRGRAAAPLSVNGPAFAAWGKGALEYEIKQSTDEAFDVDVTGCGYARLMSELGARDLGERLVCNGDFATAARLGQQLERTQTCMGGASHCDFRFRVKDEAAD